MRAASFFGEEKSAGNTLVGEVHDERGWQSFGRLFYNNLGPTARRKSSVQESSW